MGLTFQRIKGQFKTNALTRVWKHTANCAEEDKNIVETAHKILEDPLWNKVFDM